MKKKVKTKKPAKRISKSSPAKKSAAAKKAARSRKLKQKPSGDFVKEPETVHDLMKERLKQ